MNSEGQKNWQRQKMQGESQRHDAGYFNRVQGMNRWQGLT